MWEALSVCVFRVGIAVFLWGRGELLGFCVRFFSKFRMVRVCYVRGLCVEGLSVFVSGFFTGFIAFLAV